MIGDLASVEQDGRPVPGVAPAAIQMGGTPPRNMLRALRGRAGAGRSATATRARSPPSGAARRWRVLGRLRLSGLLAWLAWLFVHIFFLIGFRNRLVVLSEWAWAYLTYERGARLILGQGRSRPEERAPRG